MNQFLKKIMQDFGDSKDSREVLEEDEYLKKLEKIIIKDFYPHLKNIKENDKKYKNDNSDSEDSENEINFNENMHIGDFLRKFISEDDQSFGKIMEKEKLGFIAKHYDMFKFLKPEASKNQKSIGYKMTKMAIENQNKIEGSDKLLTTDVSFKKLI